MASESLFMSCRKCKLSHQKSEPKCPNCGKKNDQTNPWVYVVGIFIIISIYSGLLDTDQASTALPKPLAMADNTALTYSWATDSFGMTMTANLTIENNNEIAIKDVVVHCDHSSKSGTKIDSNERTIYEVIAAGQSKSFPKFNMGFIHEQAETTHCFIKRASEYHGA